MNNKYKLQGISTIGIYALLYFLVPISLSILPINYNNWNLNSKLIFNIVYEAILVLIIYLIHHDTIKKDLNDYKKNIKMYISTYIKYWFLALGLMFISNVLIQIFTHKLAPNEQDVRILFKASPLLMFILASFVAPLLEEFIYRLSIYKILYNNKKLFIIISGLIFGGMHLIGNVSNALDLLYIIPYGIPGSVFAYTLVKSNNIFVPVSLHFFNNTFSLIIQFIALFII